MTKFGSLPVERYPSISPVWYQYGNLPLQKTQAHMILQSVSNHLRHELTMANSYAETLSIARALAHVYQCQLDVLNHEKAIRKAVNP